MSIILLNVVNRPTVPILILSDKILKILAVDNRII